MSVQKTSGVPKFTLDKVKIKKYTLKYTVSLVRWFFILGICFVILYPLFANVMSSFMVADDLYDATIKYIPKSWSLTNYQSVWALLGGFKTFGNTFLLSLFVGLLQVASATLAGYGLARFKFKGRNLIFVIVILALVIPPDLLFTPRYGMFVAIKQVGSSWLPMLAFAATCTGLKCSLYIFLMRQFFRGMPKELEEAAYVDGAGPMRAFVTIMLPSAVSMMVTVFLFSFVWQWLDMTYVPIFMRDVALIANKVGNLTTLANVATDSASVALTASLQQNAAIVLVVAPLVVLYIFTQRFFVESIARSGLVG